MSISTRLRRIGSARPGDVRVRVQPSGAELLMSVTQSSEDEVDLCLICSDGVHRAERHRDPTDKWRFITRDEREDSAGDLK